MPDKETATDAPVLQVGFIYIITNLINGKQYVGQTTRSLNRRWREHCFKPPFVSVLHRAIQKYGAEHFTIRQIAKAQAASCREVLDLLEPLFIVAHDTLKPQGYNLSSGGKIGSAQHSQTRSQMSNAHKGKRLTAETKRKISVANTGRKRSAEARQNMSRAFKGLRRSLGRKLSQNTRDKIRTGHLGQTASSKTRAKMSSSRRGRIQSAETRAKRVESYLKTLATQSPEIRAKRTQSYRKTMRAKNPQMRLFND